MTELKEETVVNTYGINTNICPILNASQYYTPITLPDNAEYSEENSKNWDAYLLECARPILERLVRMTDTSIGVSDLAYYHPTYYNNQSDEIDFTIAVGDDLYNRLVARVRDDREFIDYISRFKSRDGFISNLASNQDEFIKQAENNPAATVSQIILFNARNELENAQAEFEQKVIENEGSANIEWLPEEEIGETYTVYGYTLDDNNELQTNQPRMFNRKSEALAYGKALSEKLAKEPGTTYVECYNKNNDAVWNSDVVVNEEKVQRPSLKEEYGPYKDEPYLEKIADDLKEGYDSGDGWKLDIKGLHSQDFKCKKFYNDLLETISYPVADGHLWYDNLEIILYSETVKGLFEKEELKADLQKLDVYDEEQFNKLYNENQEEYDFWIEYDLNADENQLRQDSYDMPVNVHLDKDDMEEYSISQELDADELESRINDYLSDTYGWCNNGYEYKFDKEGELDVSKISWDLSDSLRKPLEKIKYGKDTFVKDEMKESMQKMIAEKLANKKPLQEGTSNFKSTGKYPLLVFDVMDYDNDPNESVAILDENEFESLKSDVEEFNDKLQEKESEYYYKAVKLDREGKHDEAERWHDESAYMEDAKVEILDGYYECGQLYADDYYLDEMTPEDKKFVLDWWANIKKTYGLTELKVAYRFSNGETGYEYADKKTATESLELTEKSLSFDDFVKFLNKIDNSYHSFSKVKDDTRKGYRYVLSNQLTPDEENELKQYDNVEFGKATYRYAPEIEYETVIITSPLKKVKEDFETEIDWKGGVQEIKPGDYDHFLNSLQPVYWSKTLGKVKPTTPTPEYTDILMSGGAFDYDEKTNKNRYAKFGKKDDKYYYLGLDTLDKVDEEMNVDVIPTDPNTTNDAEKKEIIDQLISEVAMNCQCDNYELTNAENGDILMIMPIGDSDCEYYFDEYDIKQDTENFTNIVNITKLANKVIWTPDNAFDRQEVAESILNLLDKAEMKNYFGEEKTVEDIKTMLISQKGINLIKEMLCDVAAFTDNMLDECLAINDKIFGTPKAEEPKVEQVVEKVDNKPTTYGIGLTEDEYSKVLEAFYKDISDLLFVSENINRRLKNEQLSVILKESKEHETFKTDRQTQEFYESLKMKLVESLGLKEILFYLSGETADQKDVKAELDREDEERFKKYREENEREAETRKGDYDYALETEKNKHKEIIDPER